MYSGKCGKLLAPRETIREGPEAKPEELQENFAIFLIYIHEIFAPAYASQAEIDSEVEKVRCDVSHCLCETIKTVTSYFFAGTSGRVRIRSGKAQEETEMVCGEPGLTR